MNNPDGYDDDDFLQIRDDMPYTADDRALSSSPEDRISDAFGTRTPIHTVY